MMKPAQIIDALGGTGKVAAALELNPSTVSTWKSAGNIPKWRMRDIKDLAREMGVNLDQPAATSATTEAV